MSQAVDAPPQVKLGKVPKNARLIEAMAQHKNAKPKPKGWLMAVVDSIYKEGMFSVQSNNVATTKRSCLPFIGGASLQACKVVLLS